MKKTKTSPGNEAKNAYYREWRKNNPTKAKEYSDRYWEKRAENMAINTQGEEKGE